MSLCVKELRNNVVDFMGNLEVRALQGRKAKPICYRGASCRDSGVKCQLGVLTSIL